MLVLAEGVSFKVLPNHWKIIVENMP
jgi:hypothetical protein